MRFDIKKWERLEFEKTPVWVCPEKPDWFVPNNAGDEVLRSLAAGAVAGDSVEMRRFLSRLPVNSVKNYGGRQEHLGKPALKQLWFHLTNRCNQNCAHCLFSSSPSEVAELDAGELLAVAGQAHEMGCRIFSLTGGEPFVHRKFDEVMRSLLDLEGTDVAILTNGIQVQASSDLLLDLPRERIHLQISIDGIAGTHDRIRGEGAFVRLGRNLRWLADNSVPVTLSMCVNTLNSREMPEVVRFAAEHGVSNLHFMWYFIRGRGEQAGFVGPEIIFEQLRRSAEEAERLGIGLDNIDALKSQVFAPPGTKHDGSNSGWESAAIGPDGLLYPSAALVGKQGLGTEMNGSLENAWFSGAVMDDVRRSTAADMDSPLRFLTGGGDPDHSYMYGGRFVGGDPYEALYERAALWLIAREAARYPEDGPPRLRLKMGDLLESCGAHGEVALTHSNCLLSLSHVDGRSAVKDFYSTAAISPREDVKHFLNPVFYPEEMVSHVPERSRVRSFGCGSPVLDAGLQEGETVIDLGCGTGLECFIAARLVGPDGSVHGVDMLDNMLELSRRGAVGVATALGYENLEFHKGFLESLPFDDASVDVALSNCVINLSSNKRRTMTDIHRVLRPGGRLVISDVVCDEEPDPSVRNDEVLRGECIAGAMTHTDLFGLLSETGFTKVKVLRRFPYRKVRGHQFFSMTYEAYRPASDRAPVNVIYRGPFASVITNRGTILEAGRTQAVPRDEIDGMEGSLLVLDSTGVVTNLDDAETASCCCGPVEAGEPGFCTPPATGPQPVTTISCCTASTVSDSVMPIVQPAEPPGRYRAGCMVCGRSIRYNGGTEEMECSYCGDYFHADAFCENGHYVCDSCHTDDARAVIERICMSTRETDMVSLLKLIRSHRSVPMHGPENHALVPGVILATYRNLGGGLTAEQLAKGIRRGASIAGGSCGYMGACGAALGVGTAFGILLGSNPVNAAPRKVIQTVTARVLERIGGTEAARCCQRESFIALRAAAEMSERFLDIRLQADDSLICNQMHMNKECLGTECPLFPSH